MASQPETILVAGATGRQGGAVTRHLRANGFAVRALTRDPQAARAQGLRALGAELVRGDLTDRPRSTPPSTAWQGSSRSPRRSRPASRPRSPRARPWATPPGPPA